MVSGWSEKGPGLKILWVWTFGTAAILIASVVRTRLNDMDNILRQEDRAAAPPLPEVPESQSHHTDTILKDD